MNTRILLISFCIVFLCKSSFAQNEPLDTDSQEYKDAYELIFDARARAKKAEMLLLQNGQREPKDLNARELSLLCRVYNEMFAPAKQMEMSRLLWAKAPNDPNATRWMANSFLNLHARSEGTASADIIEFVDEATSKNLGVRRDLLILKARAVLRQKEGLTDAERRVAVSDLLIEACGEPTDSSPMERFASSPEHLMDHDSEFTRYFSAPEREALKVRMKTAAKNK